MPRSSLLILLLISALAVGCNRQPKSAGPAKAGTQRTMRPVYDDKTDFAKLSQDELTEALDSGDQRVIIPAATEIFARGPESVAAARPVFKDLTAAVWTDVRVAAFLAGYTAQPDRPSMAPTIPHLYGLDVRSSVPMSTPMDGKLGQAIWKVIGPMLDRVWDKGSEADVLATINIVGQLQSLDRVTAGEAVPGMARAAIRLGGPARKQLADAIARFGFFASTTGAVPAAEKLMADDDPELQKAGKSLIGTQAATASEPWNSGDTAPLRPLLKHADAAVRSSAALALFRRGEIDDGLPVLLAQQWPDAFVPDRPFTEPVIGTKGARVVAGVPRMVMFSVVDFTQAERKKVLAHLRPAVLGDDEVKRRNALAILEMMHGAGGPLWQELATSAKAQETRAFAKRALGVLGLPISDGQLPEPPAKNADPVAKMDYLAALGRVRPVTPALLDAIQVAANDPVMRGAAWVAWPTDPEHVAAGVPLLIEGLKGDTRFVNAKLLERIKQLGPAAVGTADELLARVKTTPQQEVLQVPALLAAYVAVKPDDESAREIVRQIEKNDLMLTIVGPVLLTHPKLSAVAKPLTERVKPLGNPGQDMLRVLLMKIDAKARERYLPEMLDYIAKAPAPAGPSLPIVSYWDGKHNPISMAELLLQLDDPPVKELTPILKEMIAKRREAGPYISALLTRHDSKPEGQSVADALRAAELNGPRTDSEYTTEFRAKVREATRSANPEVRAKAIAMTGWLAAAIQLRSHSPVTNPAEYLKRKDRFDELVAVIEPATRDESPPVRDHAFYALATADPIRTRSWPADQTAAATRVRREFVPDRIALAVERLKPQPLPDHPNIYKGNEISAAVLAKADGELLAPHRDKLIEYAIKYGEPTWTTTHPILDALVKVPRAGEALAQVAEKADFSTRAAAFERLTKVPADEVAAAEPLLQRLLKDPSRRTRWQAARALARLWEDPGADVIAVLKDAYALTADPKDYTSEQVGAETFPKLVEGETAWKRIAGRARMELAALLVPHDHENRASYLDVLVDGIISSYPMKRLQPGQGVSPETRAMLLLRELGPAGAGAAPRLATAYADERDLISRMLIAQALRGVDIDAAKKAGVR
jgi:HEAT repeat protein